MGEVVLQTAPMEKCLVAPGRKFDAVHVEDRKLLLAHDDTICKNPWMLYNAALFSVPKPFYYSYVHF